MSLGTILASYRLAGRLDPEKLEHIVQSLSLKRSTILDYVYPNNVKIAAVHMKLDIFKDLRSLVQEVCRLIDTAVKAGAHAVVFPYLFGLMPVGVERSAFQAVKRLIDEAEKGSGAALRGRFDQLMDRFADFVFDSYYNLFLMLARRYNVYIAAGSTLVRTGQGTFCRSYLFSPDHNEAFYQDQIHLTPLEKRLGIKAGDELRLLDLKIGKTALLAGPDAHFFECYKVARGLGAQIVFTPALRAGALSHTARYNCSLMAAQQFNLYTVRSSFFRAEEGAGAVFDGASGVYAPQMMTRNLDGVIVHTNESAGESHVLCARIDPPKLIDNVDVYAYSTNSGFAEVMTGEIYPEYFRELAKGAQSL